MEGLKMKEDESIRAYSQRVNEVVACIKNCGGTYTDKEVMAKIIRSVTPTFKVKAQMIQETIPMIKDFTKEKLITKLSTYEATEFGDTAPKEESAFKATIHKDKRQNIVSFSRMSKAKELDEYENEWAEIQEKERQLDEQIMALITRREQRGKGKYGGKLPLKFFLCNEIGHFASRCPNRAPKYKPKFKKPDFNNEECYYASDGVIDDEYEPEDDEIGFVAIIEENSIKEEKDLVS